jgi:Putative Ig domain
MVHSVRNLLPAVAAAIVLAALPGSAAIASTDASVSFQHACAVAAAPGHATCLALRDPELAAPGAGLAADASTAAADPGSYGPADLQSAYALTAAAASQGSGETVAIVDAYNDPNAQADVAAYRSYYGLPATTITVLNESGAASPLPANAGTSGWDVEESLDLDMVSAICPLCHIDLLEAKSTTIADLGTAARTAAALPGVVAVSNSYGGSEFAGETDYDSYYDHPGVAMTVSAGDSGYGVEYPAASPWVTAVGGTSLEPSSSTRGWTESVWGNGTEGTDGDGTGSGCSAYEPQASWQGTVSDPDCSNRTVVDVAADADPATGVCIYDSYSLSGLECGWGGTSEASPIIAATYALAGKPAASSYPASYPYAHPTKLNDVTTGSDGNCGTYLCNGGTGFNGPTGLGTPNGLLAFMNTDDTVTVTDPGSQAGTQGKAITPLTISASDAGSLPLTYTASGLPPGLAISSSGIISGTPAKGGSFTATVTATDTDGASGTASFTWTITPDTVTVTSPGNQTGTQGKAITPLTISASDAGSLPLTYTASGLPPGLAISSSGIISGTPAKGGSFTATVTATDTDGASGTARFTWVVKADKLTITNPGRRTSDVSQRVALRLHASSSTGSSVRFTTATGLPPGLYLNVYGLVSGKLTKAGTYVCTVRARDADGTTAVVKFTWIVYKARRPAVTATIPYRIAG